jgi:ATP-binding cassette subfamily F protein uup
VRAAPSPAPAPIKGSARTEQRNEPAAPVAKQKKLSYKEQRELEELPAMIAKLEAEQKSISERLAEPDLYSKHADQVPELNRRFAEIDAQLLQCLEKWEVIEARNKA